MKKNKGSITLEASIVLPFFIFILLFMYGLIMLFSGKQLMSHAALQAGQSLSLDSFAIETMDIEDYQIVEQGVNKLYSSLVTDNKNNKYFYSNKRWYEDNVENEVKKRFWGYFIGGSSSKAKGILSMIGVKKGPSQVKFTKSYLDEENDLHIIVEYQQHFLFDFGSRVVFPRKVEVITHMWGLDHKDEDEDGGTSKKSSGGGGSGSSGGGQSGFR